jgi:hypothetical protein
MFTVITVRNPETQIAALLALKADALYNNSSPLKTAHPYFRNKM